MSSFASIQAYLRQEVLKCPVSPVSILTSDSKSYNVQFRQYPGLPQKGSRTMSSFASTQAYLRKEVGIVSISLCN